MKTIIRPFEKPFSLQTTILWMFMPVFIVFILITGFVSYDIARKQLEENVDSHIQDTVAQTRNYLNSSLNLVLTDLLAFINDNDVEQLFGHLADSKYELQPDDYIVLSKNMDKLFASHYTMIDSVFVTFNRDSLSMLRGDFRARMPEPFPYDSYFSTYRHNKAGIYWRNLHESDIYEDLEGKDRVASLFKLIRSPGSDVKGILLVQLRESFFREILTNPRISDNGYVVMSSANGLVSYKNVDAPYRPSDELRLALEAQHSDSGRFTFTTKQGVRLSIIYDTLGVNKWRLAAVYPESDMLSKVNTIKYVIFSVMLFVIASALLLSNVIARSIAHPITRLIRKVNRIEEGRLDERFDVRGSMEIVILNKGIGDLMTRVKGLLAQVEEEQAKKRTAEMTALQAQIHPHFLYNTLYSIKQLCDMGENDDASRMVSALSSYFRISISRGSEIITLADEIEHVRNYLLIQEMRYGDDFTYAITIEDPALLTLPIAKLTLQPLVENAIYHGVKQRRGQGRVHIRARLEPEHVIMEVEDNGAGMSAERLDSLRRSLEQPEHAESGAAGFGVRNVQQRLRLHYGAGSGLQYVSDPERGTIVTVTIRLKEGEMPDAEADHRR